MSRKTQTLLIITAIVLIAAAAAAILFFVIDPFSGKGKERLHQPEETYYNEDGTVNRIMYYNDKDEYQGQTDFYTDGLTDYVMFYGADGEPTGSEVTKKNVAGKIASFTRRDGTRLVEEDEYVYADDFETLKKVTKKSYDAEGKETAEKLFYAEDGVTVTERFTYFEGEETSHETFTAENPYVPADTTAEE